MPIIQVDGTQYEVSEGRTILQALDDLGVLMNEVEIPHYCWHPKLSIDGSCRLCQVEVEGLPKLQIACNTLVRDGMVIHTRSDRVMEARQGVMELLLVNHPLDCPICDQAGECKLQDYAFEYGVVHSRTREARRPAKKRVDLGPTIVFDQERCILCRRCVRFCREVPETGELGVFSRGDESMIETFPGLPLDNDYSMNVADICPVGALTTRDFRFKIRVWFLEDLPGICTGCSKGCNVHLGVANNKVYRYVPRRNDAVNETWICDSGRLSYREIAAPDRLQFAMVCGERGALETRAVPDALARASELLSGVIQSHGPASLAVVVSPFASNEDLFVLRRLVDSIGAGPTGLAVRTGAADALLVQAEKAPNAEGARALGFEGVETVLEQLRAGRVRGLLVFGHDFLEHLGEDLSRLSDLDAVVVLDTHRSGLERVADVVVPLRHAAEKDGTFTNHAGRVQRFQAAVEPAFEALADGEAAARLGVSLGLPGFDGPYDVAAISEALSAALPAFARTSFRTLPDLGRPLAGRSETVG
jgi:NADH-quinone oxidoreductase subunit G